MIKLSRKKIRIDLRNSLNPDPDSYFWLDPDPDSMNVDPKHCSEKKKKSFKMDLLLFFVGFRTGLGE